MLAAVMAGDCGGHSLPIAPSVGRKESACQSVALLTRMLTGLKADEKLCRRYTGFPGGLREESFVKLLARRPEAIVEQSIKGMLPKSKMGRQMATKLKVYKGPHHPHLAQQPQALEGKA